MRHLRSVRATSKTWGSSCSTSMRENLLGWRNLRGKQNSLRTYSNSIERGQVNTINILIILKDQGIPHITQNNSCFLSFHWVILTSHVFLPDCVSRTSFFLVMTPVSLQGHSVFQDSLCQAVAVVVGSLSMERLETNTAWEEQQLLVDQSPSQISDSCSCSVETWISALLTWERRVRVPYLPSHCRTMRSNLYFTNLKPSLISCLGYQN